MTIKALALIGAAVVIFNIYELARVEFYAGQNRSLRITTN